MKRFLNKSCIVFCVFAITSPQVAASEPQQALYAPIKRTSTGVSLFLRTTFNTPEYTRDVLPYQLSHIIQLLEHGASMPSQQRAYIKSVIKLFSNKLKETSCITAQAFSELLQQLPGVIQNYLVVKHQPNKDLFSCEKRVYTILEETFLAKFDFFKEKPEEFFTTLSHDIVNALHKETSLLDEDIPREQLAQSAIRLLDICLNKLTWNPEEPTTLWPLVKTISLQLEDFFEKNIITNIDDLDDLFWSLIHRFCFFLDIAGADLPPECFALIKEELSNGNLLLIDLEEQEQCIETKLARLQRGIHEAEVKKHAYERGILVH